MLALLAIVPSAPLLVPELAGPAAVDTAPVRDAVRAVGDRLGQAATRWIAVGAADGASAPAAAADYRRFGDFGAYGVPVRVELGGEAGAGTVPLPLSMLIAGWVRGQSGGDTTVTPVVVDAAATAQECRAIGARLAAEIEASPEPIGVLVVADGATALSRTAPGGGERASAVALQARIDAALGAADCAALTGLGAEECVADGVGGRAAWQVLAALCADVACDSSVRYSGAPFGVGYSVALWVPQS
ncbi:hypothetical protein [Gordonia phthalatica]|uniref:Aromatic ring-opening dioxygenase LigA n=1 Tax=Gordonia phthalatica TaxID=1136941 RepID=A0A0N9NG05_9ACTN|nr:hypothetical protein [Gordonia phthalatica]ALG84621.1 hypothetical protein ACH46_09090 [Gordonia phthalatica]